MGKLTATIGDTDALTEKTFLFSAVVNSFCDYVRRCNKHFRIRTDVVCADCCSRGYTLNDAGEEIICPNPVHARPDNIERMFMLTVSELSEAFEGYRKNEMDKHLPRRKAVEVELADAFIRICDMASSMNLDLGGAIVEKIEFNKTRPDHKVSARTGLPGAKQF